MAVTQQPPKLVKDKFETIEILVIFLNVNIKNQILLNFNVFFGITNYRHLWQPKTGNLLQRYLMNSVLYGEKCYLIQLSERTGNNTRVS
jgi:hypothetical protein